MSLKLKLDAENHVVVKDGKPVYIDDANNNEELAFDAEQMRSKISELNGESKTHRLSAKELKESLEKFGDAKPEEVAAFRATLQELGGMDGIKKLKEKSGVDVDAIKKNITEIYESKLGESSKALGERDTTIRQLLVSNGFATSDFLSKTIFKDMRDVAESHLGRHFRVENGKPVAYIGENAVLSKERPGEVADVNEAIGILIGQHPQKDSFMLATGGGSGTPPNGGGGGPVNNKAYDSLSPVERITAARAAGQKT